MKIAKKLIYFDFVAMETIFLEPVEHVYNLILKGIIIIYKFLFFENVLTKRNAVNLSDL